MIVAVAALVAAIVLGVAAPWWLERLAAPHRHPRIALAAWVATQLSWVGVVLSVPVALVLRPGARWSLVPDATLVCVQAVRDEAGLGGVLSVEGVVGFLAAAIGSRVAFVVVRSWLRHRRETAGHSTLLGLVGTGREDGVVVLDGAGSAAYSIGGSTPTVVLGADVDRGDGVVRAAVVEHERAHLRGHHHALVLWADALRVAAPCVPLARVGASWVRVLVELSADRAAATTCGASAVCAALVRRPVAAVPEGSGAGRAGTGGGVGQPVTARFASDRARWLGTPVPHAPRLRHYSTAMLVSTAPWVVTVAVVVTGVVAYCASVAT